MLLLHPWWGATPAVQWWADQQVGVGRRVVVPDLYGGVTAATEEEEAEELAQATPGDPDATAFVQQCAEELAADGQPWAAMGFSMGAPLAGGLAGRGTAGPTELILS